MKLDTLDGFVWVDMVWAGGFSLGLGLGVNSAPA